MKFDDLTSPGLIPSAQRLRVECTKAISFVEVQADLNADGVATQAQPLIDFFEECIVALIPLVPVPPAPAPAPPAPAPAP